MNVPSRRALVILLPALLVVPAAARQGRIVHFDVLVSVESTSHRELQVGTAGLETTDGTVRSSARWHNVGFSIVAQGATPIAVIPTPTVFTGTTQAAATFEHHDAPRAYKPINCAGAVPAHSYPATLNVLIFLAVGGGSNSLSFIGHPADGGIEFLQALSAEQRARCSGDAPFDAPDLDFTLKDGTAFSLMSSVGAKFQVASNGKRPFAVDEIIAGRPFAIDSGRQKSADGRITMSVRVEFTAPCETCSIPPLDSPPPPTPKPPCDPDLQAQADRKWQAGTDLMAHANEQLKEAKTNFQEWKVEEAKTMAEIGLEKNDLLKTVELALEEGGIHLLHSAVGWFGLATTAAWIYTDVIPHVQQHDQEVRDSVKMRDAAMKLFDESIQDLKNSFGQSAACEEARQKSIARNKLLDEAKALRDKWALDGSALYRDPTDPNPYPMNADAALNRAIQILTSASSASSAASTATRSAAVPITTAQQAAQIVQMLKARAASPGGLPISASQGKAALAEIDAALQMLTAGHGQLEKRDAAADALRAALAAFIAKSK